MRVSFLGHYDEIQRSLRQHGASQGTEPNSPLGQFEQAVEEARQSQFTEESTAAIPAQITKPTTASLMPEPLYDSLRASLKEEAATMILPESAREMEVETDKPSSQTVKSPTIVDVRRYPQGSDALASLPQADRKQAVEELVSLHSVGKSVRPKLSMAVIAAESSFNPRAVSNDGYSSKGLFQLLDSTGQERLKELSPGEAYDPFNPSLNVALGVGHLEHLRTLFSEATPLSSSAKTTAAANTASLERLVVAAFNAGEGRVARAQQLATQAGKDASHYEAVAPYLPETTQRYVKRVIEFEKQENKV